MNIATNAILASLAVGLSACATLTKGTTQAVAISTPGVSGAQCTLSSPSLGTKVVSTPASLVLAKSSENITVICRKPCYHDGSGVIASSTEAMAAGNIIAGGVVGLGVDAISGAMNKYNADNQIAMVPIQGCRANGPPSPIASLR